MHVPSSLFVFGFGVLGFLFLFFVCLFFLMLRISTPALLLVWQAFYQVKGIFPSAPTSHFSTGQHERAELSRCLAQGEDASELQCPVGV